VIDKRVEFPKPRPGLSTGQDVGEKSKAGARTKNGKNSLNMKAPQREIEKVIRQKRFRTHHHMKKRGRHGWR